MGLGLGLVLGLARALQPLFPSYYPSLPPRSNLSRGVPASLRALAHPAALALAERHRGDACDNNLLQMEAELSCPREAVEGEEGELCLGVMMHRLRMLLDVYVETEGEG